MGWVRPFGRIPFRDFSKAFQGLTRNPMGNRALSFPRRHRNRGKRERTNMRKLMLSSLAIVCAMLLSGCGNSHEKMVKEMYAAGQSGDREKMNKFAARNQ